MKEQLAKALEGVQQDLFDMSDQLYEDPELGDEEFESMKLLVQFLENHQFQVEKGIVGRPTAFRAEYTSDQLGPTIAYLAEYDALPGVGHGCGHNLIGTMSVGAGVALSKVIDQTGGRVIVLGTPAEETNGAKVTMSEEGTFDDIDVAMMVHGADQSYESGSSSAMEALEFTYKGKSTHAAASPEEGINALDSVIQLFNGINALREHVPSDIRIHGVITEGGLAANVVPDLAVAQFYVRSRESEHLVEVVEKVKKIAHGAAQMTGATVDITNFELSFDNMITNRTMSDRFTNHLKEISDQPVLPSEHSFGSLDMGNVSKLIPSIHPFIGLNEPGLVFHTKEFANQTITKDGHQAIADGALALARTGYDILSDEKLLKDLQAEFNQL